MHLFSSIEKQVLGFLKISDWLLMLEKHDFSPLNSFSGVITHLYPLIPLFFIFELIYSLCSGKFKINNYKFALFAYSINIVLSRILFLGIFFFLIHIFSPFRLFKLDFNFYTTVYGFIVLDFCTYLSHFLTHKIRVLWCIHSTHHVSEDMNMATHYTISFFENPFSLLVQIPICMFLGLNTEILLVVTTLHSLWAGFLHTSEGLLKNGRLGYLENLIITPSHHRVHHGKNPLYLDTNFSGFLNIWDRLLGTYQKENEHIKVAYGITRQTDASRVVQTYFGEILALVKDVYLAPGFVNKIKYMVMPPGWSHNGEITTSKIIKSQYLAQIQSAHQTV